jgi:type II secretory pathway component PulM
VSSVTGRLLPPAGKNSLRRETICRNNGRGFSLSAKHEAMPRFDNRIADQVVLPERNRMFAGMLPTCRSLGWPWTTAATGRRASHSQLVMEKMKETVTVMNEQIKKAIRTRARKARSNEEVVEAIFNTLRDHRIDVAHVSLEDMKSAVVEATRASREEGNGNGPQPV